MKKIFLGISIMALVAIILLAVTENPLQAASDANTNQKLDKILRNQNGIMRDLDKIKDELHTIKIRVTQQQ